MQVTPQHLQALNVTAHLRWATPSGQYASRCVGTCVGGAPSVLPWLTGVSGGSSHPAATSLFPPDRR